MSLRWKLLRFQTAEKILLPAEYDAEPPSSHGLFVGAPSSAAGGPDPAGCLRLFASLSERSSGSHSAEGVYALLQPRGVVHVFRFPASGIAAPGKTHEHVAHFTVAAHESCVTAVHVVPQPDNEAPIVVTVGLDSKLVSVKFWAFTLTKDDAAGSGASIRGFVDDMATPPSPSGIAGAGSPSQPSMRQAMLCKATLRMPSDAQPSAIAVLGGHNLQSIAVGFDDASVVFFNGDLLRERFSRVRVAQAAGEMRDARPVTFLAFCSDHLLCVTEQSVAVVRPVYDSSVASPSEGRSPSSAAPAIPSGYEREALDSRGASEGSSVAHLPHSGEIAVAREEALYFFNKDGRGQCLAFPSDGVSTTIAAVGPYLVHATPPHAIVVYDLGTKVISYRANGDVRALYTDEKTRSVVLVMADMSIVRLDEVPLESRVSMLLSRGMYAAAIQLAKVEAPANEAGPSVLFIGAVRQYAQFLMGKGDYDGAASQLITTIGGAIEPSWVITRLVEQPGLRSGLRSYLEALHYAGEASFVHTRVLITCYRHDRARAAILKQQKPAEDRTTDEHIIQVLSDVDWTESQVDAAIDICCESGLYGVAERVARKRGRNVRLARTLVEHLDDIPSGLVLLRSLIDQSESFQVAEVCGRKLLARAPKEFVAVAADMISHSARDDVEGSTAHVSPAVDRPPTEDVSVAISHLARLFVDRPQWLASLLETVVNRSTNASSSVHTEAIWMMLFECLTQVDVERGRHLPGTDTRKALGRSALRVLQSRTAKIDLEQALSVSERRGHGPCLEYVYEHMRMYRELGQHLRLAGDFAGMLRACRRHGKREPALWLEAVRLVAPLAGEENGSERPGEGSSESSHEGAEPVGYPPRGGIEAGSLSMSSTISPKDALFEAMIALDDSGHMSPVEIIEAVCSACPNGKWSLVRDYFERIATRLAVRAEEDEAAASALSHEAFEVRGEITRLGDAVVIKPRLCGVCEDTLSPPSVHFFCGHSFHAACLTPAGTGAYGVPGGPDSGLGGGQRAFGGLFGRSRAEDDIDSAAWAEVECPLCAPELDATVSLRNAVEEKNARHDDFFRLLRGKKDGFDVIMDFLGRSAFI